jgi:hypothetical protein
MSVEQSVFVGVDWATHAHQVCALDAQGAVLGERAFKHTGAGLEEFVAWLGGLAPGYDQVAVGIETPHGPVVEALLEKRFAVFALNPKQMDRFRDRFTVAGAKDDRLDARVIAASLRTERSAYRRLRVEDPLVTQLRKTDADAVLKTLEDKPLAVAAGTDAIVPRLFAARAESPERTSKL